MKQGNSCYENNKDDNNNNNKYHIWEVINALYRSGFLYTLSYLLLPTIHGKGTLPTYDGLQTLGKLSNLSVCFGFPTCEEGIINSSHFLVLVWRINKKTC